MATASIVTAGYTPPLAGQATASASSLLTTTLQATTTDTYWAAATATGPASPTIPPRANDHDYLTEYLSIHQLSTPSARYVYTLYFVFAFILVFLSIAHKIGLGKGTLGAIWRKFSVRRVVIKRKRLSNASGANGGKTRRKQPFSFPSNGQLVSVFFLFALPLIFSFIGADYIEPGSRLFDYRTSFVKRSTPTVIVTPSYTIDKAFWTSGARTGLIAFSLFPLTVLFALKSPPFAVFSLQVFTHMFYDTLTLMHKWAGRLVWFVTALHVALWGVQLVKDPRNDGTDRKIVQVVWIYDKFKWGVISFIFLTLLTLLSLQPIRKRFYEAFYILHLILVPLTLITAALHFPKLYWWPLSAVALWAAERLWRFIRYGWTNGWWGGLGNNTVKRSKRSQAELPVAPEETLSYVGHDEKKKNQFEMTPMHDRHEGLGIAQDGIVNRYELTSPTSPTQQHSSLPFATVDSSRIRYVSNESAQYPLSASSSMYHDSEGHLISQNPSEEDHLPKSPPAILSSFSNARLPPGSSRIHSSLSFNPPHITRPIREPIPAGYALAQLLPSRMIRLTLRLPKPFRWSPGQNVLLQIREISTWQSHPFSIVSVYDADEEQEIVLLVKARKGFTKKLWQETKNRMDLQMGAQTTELGMNEKRMSYYFSSKATKLSTPKPVFFRALVDGPYGSSARVNWGQHATVLIICGGSGVSFGTAILAYVCECMASRDKMGMDKLGKGGKHFSTTRVRFVWIVREFAEVLWVSNLIRKCLDLVPSSQLQVDIFVTHYEPSSAKNSTAPPPTDTTTELVPPRPLFAKGGHGRSQSASSFDSVMSVDSNTDLGYLSAANSDVETGPEDSVEREDSVLELTNYDEDQDEEDAERTLAERQLSLRVKKEGRVRRARSRKKAKVSRTFPFMRSDQSDGHSHSYPLPPSLAHPSSSYATDRTQTPTPVHPDPANRSPPPRPPIGRHKKQSSSVSTIETTETTFEPTLRYDGTRTPDGSFIHTGRSESTRKLVGGEWDESRGSFIRVEKDGEDGDQFLDDGDEDDLNVVAEMARPGRPKLDKIVQEEVDCAQGTVVVASCGPSSLNSTIRNISSNLMNPGRAHKRLGHIAEIYTEEYGY